jgi:hypothetical protein
MAARNIRPRVLSAIHSLGTFTVAELCQLARLNDRGQAYSQITLLRERGFLEQRTINEGKQHAPVKVYSLVADASKRAEFARELAEYQPSLSLPGKTSTLTSNVFNEGSNAQRDTSLEELAINDAHRELTEIEASLEKLKKLPTSERQPELDAIEGRLQTAWTNIETAQLERDAETSGKDPAGAFWPGMEERWRRAEGERLLLKRRTKEQMVAASRFSSRGSSLGALMKATSSVTPLGVTALAAIFASELHVAPTLASVVAALAVKLLGEYLKNDNRAAQEVLLDEMRADKDYPFIPLFQQALRSGDAKLMLEVLGAFRNNKLPWWNYNFENTKYLATSKLREKEWLAAYTSLRPEISHTTREPFDVYACDLGEMTPDRYMKIAQGKGQLVSVVSAAPLAFLGAAEVVQPTLLLERGSMRTSLECSFLDPDKKLNAYGPIANDLVCWSGAPDLRVAASLGTRGLPIEKHLRAITDTFHKRRALIVLQGSDPQLTSSDISQLSAVHIARSA